MTGLIDKLYWREIAGKWHCFEKRVGLSGSYRIRYVSLCDVERLRRIGGQKCDRPAAILRCAFCDLAEMERRGKEESMPASDS